MVRIRFDVIYVAYKTGVQFRYSVFFMANNTEKKNLNTDTIFGVKGDALHKLNGGENVIYHRLNKYICEREKKTYQTDCRDTK